MPHHSLADFVEELEQAGELSRVGVEVECEMEIAAVTARVSREGGRAILFQRVRGHQPPVVSNLLGSETRVCRALGIATIEELSPRLLNEAGASERPGWWERLRGGSLFAVAPRQYDPKPLKSGACQQVVRLGRDINLMEWPATRDWPLQPRRTITAGVVVSRDPERELCSLELTPLEIVDKARLAVVWHRFHRGRGHLEACQHRREPLPVAVFLGSDPSLMLAAIAPLPADVDSWQFAGWLRGRPIELVKCRSHDLAVPADAEIVIEGFVDPAEPPIASGPLAGADGYYTPTLQGWPLSVTTITHRANPVFPAIMSGGPPSELAVMLRAIERLWLPVVRQAVPELVDYALPADAGPHNLAVVAIRKTYPRQAHKVAAALWGLEALMFTRLLVIVDADVEVRDPRQVLLAVGANVHPGRDVFFHDGPAHPLDHATPVGIAGHGLAIDATAKLPEEHGAAWPQRLSASREIMELVEARWSEYGL